MMTNIVIGTAIFGYAGWAIVIVSSCEEVKTR